VFEIRRVLTHVEDIFHEFGPAPAHPLRKGAIAAVMGAFIITFPHDRIRTILFFFIFIRVTFIPAAFLIGFWFLIQVLNVGSVASVRTGGVAYLAHVGGFLFGVVTARVFVNPNRIASRQTL